MVTSFSKRLWLNIGIVGLVLVVFGISSTLLSFSISGNGDFIYGTRQEIATRSGVINELSRLKKEALEVQPFVVNLASMIPLRDSVIVFSEYAKKLADENDLTFIFRFGEEGQLGNLFTSSFNITIQGGYNGVRSFIDQIEKAPYFVRFGEISMVRQLEKYSSNLSGELVFKK